MVAVDDLVWAAVRAAVDAVRYSPARLRLLAASAARSRAVPAPAVRWLGEVQARPTVVHLTGLPHAMLRALAEQAGRAFGPTGSALVRYLGGAVAGFVDRVAAAAADGPLRPRAHPGLLVPHPHDVAVLALDMRGFSQLTHALDDTQYLADLLEEYLTVLTATVEQHRGVVFQYTGDGFLALFLPELAGVPPAAMVDRLVHEMCPRLHHAFDALHARWRAEWRAAGRATTPIGLGVGLSFGRVTLGFVGPSGKKQVGAIGEPVNVAAVLCAESAAGAVMVDRDGCRRVGVEPLGARPLRLRSRKLGRRLDVLCFDPPRARRRFPRLVPTA
ncbi:MAG: adenylate/guanylate cyclase domain-containing protein [bacterium]|nr:adenylate/guanylate cyclase domain-containing protein [bacterium]